MSYDATATTKAIEIGLANHTCGWWLSCGYSLSLSPKQSTVLLVGNQNWNSKWLLMASMKHSKSFRILALETRNCLTDDFVTSISMFLHRKSVEMIVNWCSTSTVLKALRMVCFSKFLKSVLEFRWMLYLWYNPYHDWHTGHQWICANDITLQQATESVHKE